MWRSFFTAIGICLVILGAESLIVDRVVLNTVEKPAESAGFFAGPPRPREIIPRDWAPWSFLSSGVVTILYSITLRKGGGEAK